MCVGHARKRRVTPFNVTVSICSDTHTTVVTDRDEPFAHDGVERLFDDGDSELKEVMRDNWLSIKSFHKCHRVMDVLNVRVWDPELESIDANAAELLVEAWKATRWQCKINASIGCILHHRESGRYRYFHASPNEGSLYDKPKHIASLDAFIEDLSAKDVEERAARRRPNTEWRMYALTNLAFYMYKLQGVSMVGTGTGSGKALPRHLLQNKHLLCLLRDPRTGKAYDDNLCFFRVWPWRWSAAVSARVHARHPNSGRSNGCSNSIANEWMRTWRRRAACKESARTTLSIWR